MLLLPTFVSKSYHIGGIRLLRSRDKGNNKSLERIFPPSFFDIMIHLPIHLANEVRLGCPILNRWMYSPERELGSFKSNIHNIRYPEGCIEEARVGIDCMNLF